jgi:hypothetical protein
MYALATMTKEYRIEQIGHQFIAVDPWDEIVDRFQSEEEARQSIERCKKQDEVWDMARLLMENAIKAHMQLNGVDRETSERAFRDVMDG